jgi:hypothetical protein
MEKQISKLRQKTLSGADIKKFFNGKIKIVLYSDLRHYKNIDQLLNPYGRVVMLYYREKEPNYYGHWISIFRNGKGNVEVFDPYGTFIDQTLKNINTDFRIENYEYTPYLSKLLLNQNKYKIEYNDVPLQKMKKGTNTCGRWAIVRNALSDMSIEMFQKIFSMKNNGDDLVSILTKEI